MVSGVRGRLRVRVRRYSCGALLSIAGINPHRKLVFMSVNTMHRLQRLTTDAEADADNDCIKN